MSQPNQLPPKEGPILTLTADDLSGAIGAALKAADQHNGKPAGKKQVALNAAAKFLSGPRANWGALKAKEHVVTQAARSRPSNGLPVLGHQLDETQFSALPEKVVYDEFGLYRYDLEGEADLRRLFAPVFARGVSIVSIPLKPLKSKDSNAFQVDWTLYGKPVFLDRALKPAFKMSTYELGLTLKAFEHLERFETETNLNRNISTFSESRFPTTMNITQFGTVFIGLPARYAFWSSFVEPNEQNDGVILSDTFQSTYANIRAYLGPTDLDLDVDAQFADTATSGGCLPIQWFVDPTLESGLFDPELIRDLVFDAYQKFCWKHYNVQAESAKSLLQHIAQKAQKPWQERFKRGDFQSRHWEDVHRLDPHQRRRSQPTKRNGNVFARLGKMFA